MKMLEYLIIILVIFVVIYMILKVIEQMQENRIEIQHHEPTPREIEITSRDLYVKAENLTAMAEVYELQLTQISHEIDEIDEKLSENKKSFIRMSNNDEKLLVGRSLRLQERKCILESKILKINDELAKIALEEYRRHIM